MTASDSGWRQIWRRRWLPVVLVAAALAAWPACLSRSGHAEGAARLDFTLKDMAGKDVRLAELAGRPLVLNFWATWCGPCRIEIPYLVELQESYRDRGLVILGISTDDEPEDLRRFAAEYKMNYPVLVGLGQDELLRAYNAVDLLPITWFVKADGTLAGHGMGLHSKQWFDEQIKALF